MGLLDQVRQGSGKWSAGRLGCCTLISGGTRGTEWEFTCRGWEGSELEPQLLQTAPMYSGQRLLVVTKSTGTSLCLSVLINTNKSCLKEIFQLSLLWNSSGSSGIITYYNQRLITAWHGSSNTVWTKTPHRIVKTHCHLHTGEPVQPEWASTIRYT